MYLSSKNRSSLFAMAFTVLTSMNSGASGTELWFSPRFGAPDYMDLFHCDASWWKTQPPVSALEVASYKLVTEMNSDDLSRVRDALKCRKVELSVGLLAIPNIKAQHCGYHVEGFSAPGQPFADAQYLKKHDVDVQSFGMDEPLYFGHTFGGENACHLSVDALAKEVASALRNVRDLYPDSTFGDVEPIGTGGDAWVSDLIQWFDSFHAETGSELGFFRVDVQWNGPWREQLRKLAPELAKRHIPLQVIFNGLDTAKSDREWVNQAIANVKAYSASGLPSPAVAMFQFWTARPARALPNDDSATMTGLLKVYGGLKAK